MSTDDERQRLAVLVLKRREELRLSIEKAAKRAQIGRLTWRAVEAGKPVRGASYVGVEDALEWQRGSVDAVLAGGEPSVIDRRRSTDVSGVLHQFDMASRMLELIREQFGDEVYRAAVREIDRRISDEYGDSQAG